MDTATNPVETDPAAIDPSGPGTPADLDARLTAAVDIARAAVEASGEGVVGAHLDAVVEGECTVTHYFEAEITGYRGWVWCAVLATCPTDSGPADITVSEIALLPGADALVAPGWVPWNDRIEPGDLSPGDLLPAAPDDPRLVPNHIDSEELTSTGRFEEVSDVALELGLGRERVLSREGRDDAAQRWHDGPYGPDSDMAVASRMNCGACGFYLPLAGSLRAAFGVCANEFSADGRVVAADHGCGAHTEVTAPTGEGSPTYDAYDDGAIEISAAPVHAAPVAEVQAPVDPSAGADA